MREVVRIAMWSGPRNISTALMRSFENRADTVVVDEPFYAAYLARTGLVHPMREEVLAAQAQDWCKVVAGLLGDVPGEAAVFYQKQMTHHMLQEFGRDWFGACRHGFLIRHPAAVLRSYVQKRGEVCLQDIGIVQQAEIFERVCDDLGACPPVVDGAEILAKPEAALRRLCAGLGIEFLPEMLCWPPGRRASDGVWAPAWYAAVEASTGFGNPPPPVALEDLPGDLRRIAEAALPFYEKMRSAAPTQDAD